MSKSLSLRTVASAVGVSASLISQVETGKTRPSVSTLYALVNFLGISFDELVGDPGAAGTAPRRTVVAVPAGDDDVRRTGTIVQQSADNPVLEMENGVRWERLATGAGGPVDPLLVTYEPGASSSVEGKMMRHSGTEYAYLLSGELTVRVDFDTFVLRAGDSLNFDSVRPHMYVNHGTVPAKGLWFVVGRRDLGDELPVSGVPTSGAADQLNSAVDILQAMDRLS